MLPLLWGDARVRPLGNSVRLRGNQDHLPRFVGSGYSQLELISPLHMANLRTTRKEQSLNPAVSPQTGLQRMPIYKSDGYCQPASYSSYQSGSLPSLDDSPLVLTCPRSHRTSHTEEPVVWAGGCSSRRWAFPSPDSH